MEQPPAMTRRRLSQLPSLTPSVAAAAQTTLEAVDVTLLLATASAAQVPALAYKIEHVGF